MKDWGVLDFKNQSILWGVSEEKARHVLAINIKAHKLVKNIQSNPE